MKTNSNIKKSGKRLSIALGIVQLFIGIGGIGGGILMVIDPSGAGIGLKQNILAGSPFTDFLIPGLTLLSFNGIFVLVAAILSFIKFRWAGELGILFGIWLIGFMAAEIWWVGLTSFLQYLFPITGIVELILGGILWKFRLLKSQ